MWELFTRGDLPYLNKSSRGVMDHVVAGGRLEKPDQVPDLM